MKKAIHHKEKIKSQKSNATYLLRDLERQELSGKTKKDLSLAISDTDEDEDEGIGDATIHRSDDDLFSK